MKTITSLLMTVFLLFGWSAIQAQQGNANNRRAQSQAEMQTFFDGLGLTENQMTQINAEKERFANDRSQMRQKNKAEGAANAQTRNNAKSRGQSLRQTHMANMQGIMNADQYAKFETKQKEMHAKRGSKPGQGQGKGQNPGNGQGMNQGSGQGSGQCMNQGTGQGNGLGIGQGIY